MAKPTFLEPISLLESFDFSDETRPGDYESSDLVLKDGGT